MEARKYLGKDTSVPPLSDQGWRFLFRCRGAGLSADDQTAEKGTSYSGDQGTSTTGDDIKECKVVGEGSTRHSAVDQGNWIISLTGSVGRSNFRLRRVFA